MNTSIAFVGLSGPTVLYICSKEGTCDVPIQNDDIPSIPVKMAVLEVSKLVVTCHLRHISILCPHEFYISLENGWKMRNMKSQRKSRGVYWFLAQHHTVPFLGGCIKAAKSHFTP